MKFKKFLLMLLIFTSIFIMSIYVFEATSTYAGLEHIYDSELEHKVYDVIRYEYVDSNGKTIKYDDLIYKYSEGHKFSDEKYSWQEYHSGSLHYGYYTKTCEECNYIKGEWHSWPCRGGNGIGCILPQRVKPSNEIE